MWGLCPQPLSCLLPDPSTKGRSVVIITKENLELRVGNRGD